MTVAAAFMGLLPIMWSTSAGADVMKRIAAPMIGGLVTSFLLELLVYPAIYKIWKQRTDLRAIDLNVKGASVMNKQISTVTALLLVLGLSTFAVAAPAAGFESLAGPYETIRKALLHDKLTGVAEQAKLLQQRAGALTKAFTPRSAGVAADKAPMVKALLPEVTAAAARLATAKDLTSARNAFADLSKPMVRYREVSTGKKPVVAYCPMAKKSWLQPAGEIGNPYYGQSMAKCGDVVSK
jgi:AcrB/AcrD/AcrF family